MNGPNFSRRRFVQGCAAVGALVSTAVLESWSAIGVNSVGRGGASRRILSLDRDWLFRGKLSPAPEEHGLKDPAFSAVTLPHCVTPLSWQNWDPAFWESVWIYSRDFAIPPELNGLRLFLHFDRIMAGASPMVNGHALPQHLGGFLPFEYEITGLVNEKVNSLRHCRFALEQRSAGWFGQGPKFH